MQAYPNENLIEAARQALRDAAVPDKAAPMQAYMKSSMPFLGVQKKARQVALMPVFRDHPIADAQSWRATIEMFFMAATYREEWYGALELLGHRVYSQWLDIDCVSLCDRLIEVGAWWDIVDELATRRLGLIFELNREALTPQVQAWASDANKWRRRTSIIIQLKHKGETDLNLLRFAILKNINDDDFFIRKAIGWALREYAKTDALWVERFVCEHSQRLSTLSRREALRNLCKHG